MDLNEYLNHSEETLTLVGPLYTSGDLSREPLVFIDGGSQFQKGDIGFCVGDGDSTTKPLDQTLPQEKDDSDLSYVLKTAKDKFSQISLFGFLGGRKDHELMNLAEVHTLLKTQSLQAKAHFEQKITAFSHGIWNLNINGTFSLFTFAENKVTLSGYCKYPIADESLRPLSSHGLSNEGSGAIQLQCSSPLFLFDYIN